MKKDYIFVIINGTVVVKEDSCCVGIPFVLQ